MDRIKSKENLMYITIIMVVLLALLSVFSFAYFANEANIQNALALNVTFEEGISATLTATGNENVTLTVAGENMLNDTIDSISGTANTAISLVLESKMDITCTYEVAWLWSEDTPNQYTKTSSTSSEFTISGTDGTQSIPELQVNNYSAPTVLGVYKISTSNGTTTQNWNYVANFYNINANQDAHAGATYKGKVVIQNADCVAGVTTDSN